MAGKIEIVRTRRGARLVQDDAVLSEILARPGPSHGVFDVLAAAIAAFASGPRCLILGFAGGGVIAPLRAMGYLHPIDAVDRSPSGQEVFLELSSEWAGEVRLHRAEAAAWLRRHRRRWDVILEDLSVPSPDGVVKPAISHDPLPGLIRRRLAPGGVAITNLLPRPGFSWAQLAGPVARAHAHALLVILRDYENRILLAGQGLLSAWHASRRLRGALRLAGSRIVGSVQVTAATGV